MHFFSSHLTQHTKRFFFDIEKLLRGPSATFCPISDAVSSKMPTKTFSMWKTEVGEISGAVGTPRTELAFKDANYLHLITAPTTVERDRQETDQWYFTLPVDCVPQESLWTRKEVFCLYFFSLKEKSEKHWLQSSQCSVFGGGKKNERVIVRLVSRPQALHNQSAGAGGS